MELILTTYSFPSINELSKIFTYAYVQLFFQESDDFYLEKSSILTHLFPNNAYTAAQLNGEMGTFFNVSSVVAYVSVSMFHLRVGVVGNYLMWLMQG